MKNVGQSFYIKTRLWGREQDSEKTEREGVSERQRIAEKERWRQS
jgi:hypothetical protein